MHWDSGEHQVCVVQTNFSKGGQTPLSLPGVREKKFLTTSNIYNLTIRMVKFCETFYTCSFSSLKQDTTAESAKKF
jgi:hypothetical protein